MPLARRQLCLLAAAALAACESNEGESEIEATLSVDPRFVASLQTGPLSFDVAGSATADGGADGVVSIYVSRSNAEGCIELDAPDAQTEGPFVGFESTADIYRYRVDAESFELTVNGVCLGACTADAAAELSFVENDDGLEPAESLTEAVFFNIDCAEL